MSIQSLKSNVSRVACVVVLYVLGTVFLVLFRHSIAEGSHLLFFAVVIPYAVATLVAFTSDLAAARTEFMAWKAALTGGTTNGGHDGDSR